MNQVDLFPEKVSVVIPCYNDEKYIIECVNSIYNQTYSNIELIIVDDGSNLSTKKTLRELNENRDFILVSQDNFGQSHARNKGITMARGKYILVLDSDDFFEPSFVEKAVRLFNVNSSVKAITCHARRFCNSTNDFDIHRPKGGRINNFLFGNAAIGNSLFLKKDWALVGGYDEKMKSGFEDWEFYIRLLKNGGEILVIPEVLFNYRIKTESTSTRANKLKYELFYIIYEKHKDLYLEHSDALIKYLLGRIEREEKEKLKNLKRIEFRLGHELLLPFRRLKSFFKPSKH